jgi:hypothetical protein
MGDAIGEIGELGHGLKIGGYSWLGKLRRSDWIMVLISLANLKH